MPFGSKSKTGRRMDIDSIRVLLDQIKTGRISVDAALRRLRHLPYEKLGFATLDHHRPLRQGHAEVVYCTGKTTRQVVEIVKGLRRAGSRVLATRVTPEVARAIRKKNPGAVYHEAARVVVLPKIGASASSHGKILVLTAGTADIPVAEEARVTAETLGSRVETLFDVGVAGLHRILDHLQKLEEATVIIVVAGMDGVLPSVVGGLTNCPVLAVPTSTGYGTGAGGLAALLTMLNACTPGIGVLNIDNGFGAGVLAHRILQRSHPQSPVPRPRIRPGRTSQRPAAGKQTGRKPGKIK